MLRWFPDQWTSPRGILVLHRMHLRHRCESVERNALPDGALVSGSEMVGSHPRAKAFFPATDSTMADALAQAVRLLSSTIQADAAASTPFSATSASGLAAQLAPSLRRQGRALSPTPFWSMLAVAGRSASEDECSTAADKAWPSQGRNASPANGRLAGFVVALLSYAGQHEPPAAFLPGAGTEPSELVDAFKDWAQVYARAALVFQQPDAVWFGKTLILCGRALLQLALSADAASSETTQPRTADAAGRLSKSVGVSSNDRSALPCSETKRAAVLPLAVLSFKAYFALDNLRMCNTVAGSVDNALKSNKEYDSKQENVNTRTGEEAYALADRVAYHHYIGRLRLGQQAFRAAYTELRWAFDHAPYGLTENSENSITDRNLRLIAIPLLTVALIQGIFPSPKLYYLSALAPLAHVYQPLEYAVQKGNGALMMQLLQAPRRKAFLRRHKVYLLLQENLPLLAWRCLVRRSYVPALSCS